MKYVTSREEGGVAVLSICNEKALNALNEIVLQELSDMFDSINLEKIRCIVLTGAGNKAFVAGADISSMQKFDKEDGRKFSEFGNKIFSKIEDFPIPVIAAVNGYALGGGCELALACDIRIVSEKAVFGLPETGLGIIPGFGGTQRLARLIPEGKAKEMIFAGTKMDAYAAQAAGLADRVCSEEQLMDQAFRLAQQISRHAPIAVRKAKAVMNEGRRQSRENFHLESCYFAACFETEDQKKGMAAFLNKTPYIEYKNR